MTLRYPNTFGVFLFAVFFGVVQIFCACSAEAASLGHSNAMTGMYMQHGAGHEHIIQDDKPNNDHNDETNCAHCDSDSAISTNSDVSAESTLVASPEKVSLARSTSMGLTRANMAPDALAGLRWLHPPSKTLVALKVLLLN